MAARAPTDWTSDAMRRRIARRYAAERRFKLLGLVAILISAGFLAFLLVTMAANGLRGFSRTEIALPIDFQRAAIFVDPQAFRLGNPDQVLAGANLPAAIDKAAQEAFGPDGARLISGGAVRAVRDAIVADPTILSRKTTIAVPAAEGIDVAAKGKGSAADEARVAKLRQAGVLSSGINWSFLSASDGTDPTVVGIWGALKGSLLTMAITLALSFPIGVFAALYLEEYAPRNRWTDLIEVSINNLAAVPSIIFGLLGLAIFLNMMNLPRSAPLVGGLTLALMTMPVIVIAGRNAIKAVPPSIRDAALGVGASKMQSVFHHVLPLAMPGILTGTIIGLAQALGETAPLLLIGMVAFVRNVPSAPPDGLFEPASALPVQVYNWTQRADPAFIERASGAIIVLLVFLLCMNLLAIYLRRKFERRW